MNEKALKHIERVLFDDKLDVGFFSVKTSHIKKMFVNRIGELNLVMF
jgi:hypothetical protein